MGKISSVVLPSGDSYDIKAAAIPYGKLDSSSTATVLKATVPGITSLYSGVCVWLTNGVITSASGCTLNINNLGAKPIYSSQAAATAVTTLFNINYTALLIYNEERVTGGCWDYVYGYDSNTNTIGYQIRTQAVSMPMDSVTYRYRLLFQSADGKKFVPANNSTSTNATSSRTVNQTPIDPFGLIVYYGTTSSVAAGSKPNSSYLWQQYNGISLGYSFNVTNAALTLTASRPIYLKCTPQANGSAIIDGGTPFVQSLPSTEDGKIYILLGIAESATAFMLTLEHPVYEYKNGKIQLYTGQVVPALSNTVPAQLGNTSSAGSSSDAARADHVHKKPDLPGIGFGYLTSQTAEATLAKEAMALINFTLTNHGYVTIKFQNAVPANSTLNINNTGAYPIYYHGSAIVDDIIKAGDYATFVFTGSVFVLVGIDRKPTAADVGAIPAPSSPSNGQILSYSNGGWVANELYSLLNDEDAAVVTLTATYDGNVDRYRVATTRSFLDILSVIRSCRKVVFFAGNPDYSEGLFFIPVNYGNSYIDIYNFGYYSNGHVVLTSNQSGGMDGYLVTIETGEGKLTEPLGPSVGDVITYTSSGWVAATPPAGLPAVTSSDNGKVLRVVNGAWAAASLPSASGVSF